LRRCTESDTHTNVFTNANSNSYVYSNRDSYTDSDCNSNAHGYDNRNTDSYCDRNGNSQLHAKVSTYAQESSHTGAATLEARE